MRIAGLADGLELILGSGFFIFMIGLYDLVPSIKQKSIMRQKKLAFLFCALFVLYFCEMASISMVRIGWCKYAIGVIAFCHYSIKVLVSYTYIKRSQLVMAQGTKIVQRGSTMLVVFMKLYVVFTWLVNVLKTPLGFYSSSLDSNGDCKFDLGGWWGILDEAMFGGLDFFTLLMLTWFYIKTELQHAEEVIRRMIYLSFITLLVTVGTIVVGTVAPTLGLHASLFDVITDILTIMRLYTTPKQAPSNSNTINQITPSRPSRASTRPSRASRVPTVYPFSSAPPRSAVLRAELGLPTISGNDNPFSSAPPSFSKSTVPTAGLGLPAKSEPKSTGNDRSNNIHHDSTVTSNISSDDIGSGKSPSFVMVHFSEL